jgi:indole-3-glycerol phosphate synthase
MQFVMTILDEIFAHKHEEVAARRREIPLPVIRYAAETATAPLDFENRLRVTNVINKAPALIAEIKRASPSKGLLCPDFAPIHLARVYAENGAAAISVLTDEKYFQGSLEILRQIANLCPRLPLLRKDFIFDEYQVYEARAAGADAVLLIAAYLESTRLQALHALTGSLGMAALIEVHNQAELEKALRCNPTLLGVNNRDLRDFTVSLDTTLRLRPQIPPEICLVAESGIHTANDVRLLDEVGVNAILVGEALVTAPDIGGKIRSLGIGD